MSPTYEITAEEVGRRLDVFLAEKYPEVSRGIIQKLIKDGSVTVNGKKVTPHLALRLGDRVEMNEEPQPVAPPEMKPRADIKLDVVYEDDDVAVINKPSGLLVHPTVRDEHDTLAHAVLAYWPQAATVGEAPERPGIVHRLDREASGLMVIAKTKKAFDSLKRQFQKHTVKKEYVVLVYGRPPKDEGTIDLSIGRSAKGDRMAARAETLPGDREAITHYRIKEILKNATLLDVTIETGRTHQIRAHFKALGNPVVGDPLYQASHFTTLPINRLFLHAARLAFTHPTTRRKMKFEAPLPPELEAILTRLRQD
ncbi:MAG: RluA family pseudouridine synthase [Patescibacteria group bacterium]|nr:RluA family pseudouridine synthase [Patescibacteria group bacterium]